MTPADQYIQPADIRATVWPGTSLAYGGEFHLAPKYDDGEALVMFEESLGGSGLANRKSYSTKEFDTTVEAYASCPSAYAYAWLSGKRRFSSPAGESGR